MSKESKATASDTDDNQVAARDTTFDGVKIERFWIGVTNLKDKEKLQVIAEINGIDKVVWEMKPSYAERTEGLVSDYSNFKWLLEAYAEQKVLEERARSARLLEALKFYADKNNWLRDEKGWRHDMIINDLDDETLTDWDGRFSGKKAREALESP